MHYLVDEFRCQQRWKGKKKSKDDEDDGDDDDCAHALQLVSPSPSHDLQLGLSAARIEEQYTSPTHVCIYGIYSRADINAVTSSLSIARPGL